MAQHSLYNFLASPLTHDEQACIYSALILVDDDLPITEDKIKTLLTAANVEVEPIWPSLFARALQGLNVRDLITGAGGAAAMAAGGAGAAPAGGAAEQPKEEEKKEAPPVVEEDDSDEDFGLSLFD